MKGQTLIELLIGLAIAVVVISSITILSISSLSNVTSVQNQAQATKYAQEGMEIVRQIRNGNYAAFRAFSGTYCLAKGQSTLGVRVSSCVVPNIDSFFIRSVQIAQGGTCGASVASATVSVTWTDKQCQAGVFCRKSQLVSCFSTVNPFL